MFVRAVWRQERLVDVRPNPREVGAPPRRNTDILGVCRPDFAKMTRGLFDRQGWNAAPRARSLPLGSGATSMS